MIIAGIYSFNLGREIIEERFGAELAEIEQVITSVDSSLCKTKTSLEKTMPGRTLYSPRALNRAFTAEFQSRNWEKFKVRCEYPSQYYTRDFVPRHSTKGAFREMDFIKNRVGVEIQFGKYAFISTLSIW